MSEKNMIKKRKENVFRSVWAVTSSKFDPAERDPVKQQNGRRSSDWISLARQSTSVYLIKADVFPLSPGFEPIRINGEWHARVQVSISNSDLV